MYLKFFLILPLVLTACVPYAYQQSYVAQPLTVTQIQGQCFASYDKFEQQTNCIEKAVHADPNLSMNSYVQEYFAYMQSLSEKVKMKSLSQADARVRLAQKLNELGSYENNDIAQQQLLENQRAAQTAEILQRNQMPQVQLHPIGRVLPTTTLTNCNAYGGQLNCTSRQQ